MMNDIFNGGEKKNHRRSLNKSLGRLSQRNSVEVPVDQLIVMNEIFNDDVGSLNNETKKCLQKERVHAKKKKFKLTHKKNA